MAASAFTARFSNQWVAAGAVLFLISDSVLAVSRFRVPLPLTGWIVWLTYYAAQLLILIGYLNARAQRIPLPSAVAVPQ